MFKQLKINHIAVLVVIVTYVLLFLMTSSNYYFWDTILLTSTGAHWYYLNDFAYLIMPEFYSGMEIRGTIHPPLACLLTAVMWKIFGYKLWVSHFLALLMGFLLLYNTWKLLGNFISNQNKGWVFLILLTEVTVLAQYVIPSPDFILLTGFILSLRGVFSNKKWILAIGLILFCGSSIRGVFAGFFFFIAHLYYVLSSRDEKNIKQVLVDFFLPYLPFLSLFFIFYINYFIEYPWWIFEKSNTISGHYSMPESIETIMKNFAVFGVRTIEYGRIALCLCFLFILYYLFRKKIELTLNEKTLLFLLLLLNGLYFVFVFITQMPFSARYFMPQFFALALFTLSVSIRYLTSKKRKILILTILLFQITGHFWIYPEKIAQPWDCTLAHLPYYELRKECFDYIDKEKIDYEKISAGFALYGNRRYIELIDEDKRIASDKKLKEYVIYSNISNMEDDKVDSLKQSGQWKVIKRFEKKPIFIEIYKRK